MRSGGAGGDLVCPVCGKKGLTALGLKLHTARMHRAEKEKEEMKRLEEQALNPLCC